MIKNSNFNIEIHTRIYACICIVNWILDICSVTIGKQNFVVIYLHCLLLLIFVRHKFNEEEIAIII